MNILHKFKIISYLFIIITGYFFLGRKEIELFQKLK